MPFKSRAPPENPYAISFTIQHFLLLLQGPEPKGAYNGVRAIDDSIPKLSLVEDRGDQKRRGRGVFVNNLSEHEVSCASDVLDLISRAQERRRVGETKMNKHSSRSHCVFTLTVTTQEFTSDGCTMECTGKLHLVDLAGSECAKSAGSGISDARERERKNINQSLLTLGRVISTLREAGKDGARIPYRDSKLTRLLQESLGGRCKTVVIATLSPSQLAVEESSSTLSYVEKAKGITNKPVATSFLKVGGPGTGPTSVRGDKADPNEANLQDWNAMLARMKYMEEQMNEAQAALARKHTQQAEIVARSEAAEAARDQALDELKAKYAECEAMKLQVKAVEEERRAIAYVLRATRLTEGALSRQAHGLVRSLEESDAGADAIHRALQHAVEREQSQAARRQAASEAIAASLRETHEKIEALGQMLAQGRAATLRAASDAEGAAAGHASRMREAAAQMAAAAEAEMRRATEGLDATSTRAAIDMAKRAQSISTTLEELAVASDATSKSISTELTALEEKLNVSELQLQSWAIEAGERRTSAMSELEQGAAELQRVITASVADAAERHEKSDSRMREHKKALEEIQIQMTEAWKIKDEAVTKLRFLHTALGEADEAAAARMAEVAGSLREATEAQQTEQRDGALKEALQAAADALKITVADATRTMSEQATELAAVAASQRADDASVTLRSAILEARSAIDESVQKREAELAQVRETLAEHRASLKEMEMKQASMREQALHRVMEVVRQTLDEQLKGLGAAVSETVVQASKATEELAENVQASAAALVATCETHANTTQQIVESTSRWGEAARGVAARVDVTSEVLTNLNSRAIAGERGVLAALEQASGEMQAWAQVDSDFRASTVSGVEMLEAACEQGRDAAKQHQIEVDGATRLVEDAIVTSSGAKERVCSASSDIEGIRVHVGEAQTVGAAAFARIADGLSALGQAQVRVINAEGDATAAMLKTRPATMEVILAHGRAAAGESTAGAASVRESSSNGISEVQAATSAMAQVLETAARNQRESSMKATQEVATKMGAVDSASGAHASCLQSTAASRAAAVEAMAEEEESSRAAQAAVVSTASDTLCRFVEESGAVTPLHVMSRIARIFQDELACTASEPVLRAHLAEHGEDAEPPVGGCGEAPQGSPYPLQAAKASSDDGEWEASSENTMYPPPPTVSVSEGDQENVPLAQRAASPNYGSMAVAELRKLLEAAKLPTNGPKSDLVARLQRHSVGGAKKHRSPPKARRPQSDPMSQAAASVAGHLSPTAKVPLATRAASMNRVG